MPLVATHRSRSVWSQRLAERLLAATAMLTVLGSVQQAHAAQANCASPQTASNAATLVQAIDCANASTANSTYQITTSQPINITGSPLTATGTAGTVITGSPITSTTATGTADLTSSGALGLASTGLTTYTGDTVVTGGILQAGAVNAFSPNSNFVVNGGVLDVGGYDNTIGSLAGTGGIVGNGQGAAATLTVGRTGLSTTYSGSIQDGSGTLALTKNGAGSLALTGFNTYSGDTVVNAGAIVVSVSTQQSSSGGQTITGSSIGSGTLVLNGGTLQNGAGDVLTLGNAVQVTTGNGTFDQNRGGLTLSGTIAGAGAITYANTGGSQNTGTVTPSNSFVLLGANTNTGGSILRYGVSMTVDADNALGTGSLEADSGSVTNLDGFSQTVTTLTGGGIIFASGGNNAVGSVTLSTLTVENGTFSGDISEGYRSGSGGTNYGDITVVKVSDGTASGGTLTLTGTSFYGGRGGSTQLQAGTIAVGANGALGTGALVMSDGTTLQAAAGNLNLANAITLNGTDTIDSQAVANGLGLNGVISGAGTLVKIGTAGLGLDAANTYTGGTLVENGRVYPRNNAAFGTGTVTFAGGGLRAGASGITIANAATLSSATTFDTQSYGLTYAGVIAGAGQLTKIGASTLALTGANTYSGGTVLSEGTLNVAVSTAQTQGQNPVTSSSIGSGTLTMDGGILQAQKGTVVTLGNAVQVTANGATFDSNTGALHLEGNITGVGGVVFVATGQSFTGNDFDNTSISLAGANTYSGGSTVQSGATVQVLANNALGSGGLAVAAGGDVDLAGFSQTVTSLNGAGQIVGTGSHTGAQNSVTIETLSVQSGAFSGVLLSGDHFITNGSGGTTVVDYGDIALVKGSDGSASGGVLTLSGNSTYGARGGGTSLQAGTIVVGSNNALGSGTLAMANGTTLAEQVGVTLANAVTLAGTDTFQSSDASGGDGLVLNGVVSGSGTLVKTGASGLRLAGLNTYSGGTLLDAGHIGIGSNAALGTGTLTFAGGFLRAHADGFTVSNAAVLQQNGAIDTNGFGLTYAGAIAGAGQLAKYGVGTLTLSAANSYAGGTALNAGTLALSNNGALGSGALAIADGTTLQQAANGLTLANAVVLSGSGTVDTQAFANGLALTGVVSGSGALVKVGSADLALAAANSYAGGTTLAAGSVTIFDKASLGTGTVTFSGGSLRAGVEGLTVGNAATLASSGTIDTQAFVLTETGAISGAGQLIKNGTGTLILSNANSYAGGTMVNAGTLQIGNAGALGSGTLTLDGGILQAGAAGLAFGNAVDLAANATIDTQGFGLTANGTVSGAGQLAKAGTGTLTLTGANSYTGGTALNVGTLAVGNGAALGTGTLSFGGGILQAAADGLSLGNGVALASNGTIDTQGFGLAVSGIVSGAGQLIKLGTGTLALTAANTYAGGTALNAGTLAIDNAAALGTGAVTFGGGSLQAAADGLTLGNGLALASSGTIDTQGFGFTVSGVVSGSGQLTKLGTGTLALTAANTFSGGTALNAGTLAIGSAAALGTGALAFGGGTLQAAADGLTLANPLSLGTFGTIDTQAFSVTQAGVVSGGGQLVKVGSGTLALTAANTYSGGTALNAGTLAVGTGAALGSGALTFGGGTLQAGIDGLSIGNALVLASNGTIDTQAFGLTASGVVSGTGQLAKIGNGTLTLTAANTYSGGTVLNAGTLAIGSGAALGAGGLTIGGGTLQATANGVTLTNATVLSGNGTIDTQAFAVTESGVVSGPAGLTKLGTGTLSLTGANSYSGGTALTAGTIVAGTATALGTGSLTFGGGTLQAGVDGLSLANAVTLKTNGIVDTQGTTFGLTGVVAGSGALTKLGTGTLALGGNNSYGGGTVVTAGTLAVGTNTALGTGAVQMADGTTLQFLTDGLSLANTIVFTGNGDPTIDTGSGSETISGPISGASSLTKIGAGTLDLTGIDTYTGATTVAAGTLLVDGSIANSAVTVDNGAILGGGGTIGGLTLQSGAVIAPAVRTLTIGGNLAFASGSTYKATINDDGTSSRIAVGGTATLGGATLALITGTGSFGINTTATVLTAAGGVSGTFGSVTSDMTLAFLNPTASYTPNSVTVALTRNSTTLQSVAATPNQSSVAGAIASLGPTSPVYRAVLMLTPTGAQQAFNALSGLSHSNTERIATSTTRMLNGVVVDRLWDVGGSGLSAQQVVDQFGTDTSLPALVRCYGPVEPVVPQAPKQSYTAWGEGFGTFGHTDGGANGGTMDRSLGGFILGIDTPLSGVGIDHWRAGVAAGYSDTTYASHLDNGSGTVQSVFGSLYGGARYGAVDIRLGATIAGQQTDAQRTVLFPGFLETEKSSNGGLTVQGFGEVGYRFATSAYVLEPVAGLAVLHVHQDGFRENGGAAALVSSATDSDVGTTTLGVRGEVSPFKGVPLVAHAFLGWQHLIGNASPATTLAFEATGSSPFSVSGTPLDRDALAAEAAIDYRISAALDVGLSYAGTVGATAADHSIKGRMEYRF